METISRYVQNTIKGQMWETLIIEGEGGTFKLREVHVRKDGDKVIKDVTKQITKAEAEQYKELNKKHLAETYKY